MPVSYVSVRGVIKTNLIHGDKQDEKRKKKFKDLWLNRY